MLYPPPLPSLSRHSNSFHLQHSRAWQAGKNALTAAVILALTSLSAQAITLTEENLTTNLEFPRYSDGQEHLIDSLRLGTLDNPFATTAKWDYSLIRAYDRSKVTIKDTSLHALINAASGNPNDVLYGFRAKGTDSEIHLEGPIDIVITQDPNLNIAYGLSALYAEEGGKIYIGNKESDDPVRIWTLANKPDTISAKSGGDITFLSTNNQMVGSFDLIGTAKPPEGEKSEVTVTFSGNNSYWFGDDGSYANGNLFGKIGDRNRGTLNVTIEKGAQWSYLGLNNGGTAREKRISAITLKDGGIITLYDRTLLNFWESIGLLDRIQEGNYSVVHDHVEIGDLKGNGGIFQLDLNAVNKSDSDVIFIEGSSDPGQHAIDLVEHDFDLLIPITPENNLIFAVAKGTAAGENGVKFVDKVNERGEGLIDYELRIASSEFTEDDTKRQEITNITLSTDKLFSLGANEYIGGTKWFIERIIIEKSAAARGFTGAGYASYDAAVEMDRHDRRLLETVRDSKDPENGLWVRVHHGRNGAEDQYRWDRTGVTIGFDRAFTEKSRAGAWFSYTEGDTEFLDVRGDGDMKRYEFALFDTLTYGNHYLDFVGRIGRVSSEYTVGNEAYTTDGDYDQDYAALSAEYGYTLKSETGVFVEPQVQFQVAYLDSFDYHTDRHMKVEAESETSTIGRVGFRAGREFKGLEQAGSIYFRGDVLHQFSDGQDATLSDGTNRLNENWGDTGTWANFGVGAVWQWKDTLGFQFDLERTAGGKTDDTWLVSGRFNYFF